MAGIAHVVFRGFHPPEAQRPVRNPDAERLQRLRVLVERVDICWTAARDAARPSSIAAMKSQRCCSLASRAASAGMVERLQLALPGPTVEQRGGSSLVGRVMAQQLPGIGNTRCGISRKIDRKQAVFVSWVGDRQLVQGLSQFRRVIFICFYFAATRSRTAKCPAYGAADAPTCNTAPGSNVCFDRTRLPSSGSNTTISQLLVSCGHGSEQM